VAYTLSNLAPLHLMCDAQDIGVSVVRPQRVGRQEASAEDEAEGDPLTVARRLPTIFVYERAVAGLGFCTRLYELHEELLSAARELIRWCPCRDGCPACVGPVLEDATVFLPTKRLAQVLLDALSARSQPLPPTPDEVVFEEDFGLG
jgi:DEAD/DEAH box helicase domain-containing protein